MGRELRRKGRPGDIPKMGGGSTRPLLKAHLADQAGDASLGLSQVLWHFESRPYNAGTAQHTFWHLTIFEGPVHVQGHPKSVPLCWLQKCLLYAMGNLLRLQVAGVDHGSCVPVVPPDSCKSQISPPSRLPTGDNRVMMVMQYSVMVIVAVAGMPTTLRRKRPHPENQQHQFDEMSISWPAMAGLYCGSQLVSKQLLKYVVSSR